MGADASAGARLHRAIERGQLPQAEEAAWELGQLRPEDALALVLLMIREQDSRWESAATRWLGQLLADHPGLGLQRAAEAADALAGLAGVMPEVNRSRLAFILRGAGLERPAKVMEATDPLR